MRSSSDETDLSSFNYAELERLIMWQRAVAIAGSEFRLPSEVDEFTRLLSRLGYSSPTGRTPFPPPTWT